MVFWKTRPEVDTASQELAAAAMSASAVIWFSPTSEILDANDNFCAAMGYERDEIVGQKHMLFVDSDYAKSDAYSDFWTRLRSGESFTGAFHRLGKNSRSIWIEASYVPIKDQAGNVTKVVKFASDITARTEETAEATSRIEALNSSQAVIEFTLDGIIVDANENFLATVGYTLAEIKGKHHGIFADGAYRESDSYKEFWADLAQGQTKAGEFQRVGKGGREIWLQATYNPILGSNGKPIKIVKFASDITEGKLRALDQKGRIDALDRSQAVIEFEPNGTILKANQNFLGAVGYDANEIVGKHHRMLVSDEQANLPAYEEFWATLRRGEFQQGEFQRFGKGGREIWIQATYNPIFDDAGKVYKVVKFATDITETKQAIVSFQNAMSVLSQNDLSVRMTDPVPDEFADLKEQFNSTVASLSGIISAIAERSETITAEVTQIAGSANDLSRRTEKQAAALEESSSALEQMTVTVSESAKAAKEADVTSASATERTSAGLETVRKAVEAMKAIASSSASISKITSLIDDIAFQTNLLALNAGVEAARAGESGRGFAVVASEVRQLAQRSSDAAKEISDLITQTSQQVQSGVKLVDESGSALEEIAGFAQEIRDRVSNMANSSHEQSIGLKEINTAMAQLDNTTQQNAAMFEETTAATQSLQGEARALTETTQLFSMGGQTNQTSGTVVRADFSHAPSSTTETAPHQAQVANASGANPHSTQNHVSESDGWEDF